MKLMIVLWWMGLAFRAPVYSQPQIDAALFPVSQNGKLGYIDTTGKLVIAPQFTGAGKFCDGLAPIRISKKWGYIDQRGMNAIKPDFDEARPFSEGRGLVGVGDKYGYLDRAGRLVIKPEFDWAGPFNNRLALAEKDGALSYIDSTGVIAFHPQFDDAGDFSEGLAPIQVGYLWGYIDTNGKIVVAPQFHAVGPFSEGLARVRLRNKVGFIDKTGEYAIKPELDFAGDFVDGLATFGVGDTEGYVGKNGRVAIYQISSLPTEAVFQLDEIIISAFGARTGEGLIISANPASSPKVIIYEHAPEIIKAANPQYPIVAKKAGIEGTVKAKLWVDKRGKVRRVIIRQSDGEMLNQPAAAAARQFEFEPAKIKGKPEEIWISISFHFQRHDSMTSFSAPELSLPDGETPFPGFVPFEKAPRIIKSVVPQYPAIARAAGLEGTVWVKIWVDKSGKPRKAVIQKSAAEIFDQAAIEAATQMLFMPARTSLGPVDAWVSIPFHFRLKWAVKSNLGSRI